MPHYAPQAPGYLCSSVQQRRLLAQADDIDAPGAAGGSGSQKTNFWVRCCAFFSTSSVRLDALPAGPNMSIVIMLSAQSCLVTSNAVRIVQLPTSGLTIDGLLEIITTEGFDKYKFTTSGQGCRYWISSLLELLKYRGALREEAVNQLLNDISLVWRDRDELALALEQRGVQEGRLYRDEQ